MSSEKQKTPFGVLLSVPLLRILPTRKTPPCAKEVEAENEAFVLRTVIHIFTLRHNQNLRKKKWSTT